MNNPNFTNKNLNNHPVLEQNVLGQASMHLKCLFVTHKIEYKLNLLKI